MTEHLRSDTKMDDDEIRHAKQYIAELLILGAIDVRALRDIQERLTLDAHDSNFLRERNLVIDTAPLIDSIEEQIDTELEQIVSEVNSYLLTESELAVHVVTASGNVAVDSVVRVNDSIVPIVGDELYDGDVRNVVIGSDTYKCGAKMVYLADNET